MFEELLKGQPNLKHPSDGNILHFILHASYQTSSKNPQVDHLKCFELALKDGKVNLNESDQLGRTPLHHAVAHRNNFAVLELLRNGANLMEKSIFDETPIDEMGREVFEQFLDERINLVSFVVNLEFL